MEGFGTKDGETYREETEETGLLGMTEINICHLKDFHVNKPLSLVVPIQQIRNPNDYKSRHYEIENVYCLFTITVTDKAFGELVMNLSEFRGLPSCENIQEMQYRVMIKPGKQPEVRKEKDAKDSLASAGKVTRVEPIFTYLGPRQPYEIAQIA